MKWDDYVRMLDDRIKDYTINTQNAHKAYLSEQAKLNAAIEAKEMYEQLIKDGKL